MDPYLYVGSRILKNKKNIKDKSDLDEFENRMSILAMILIQEEIYSIFTVFNIFDIHKKIFGDIYEWSGNIRTINISKSEPQLSGASVAYENYYNIENELEKLDIKFKEVKWHELSMLEIVRKFNRILVRLWEIHPFREGNTRSVSMFMFLFYRHHNIPFDDEIFNENTKYFRNALVIASFDKFEYIDKLVTDITKKNKEDINDLNKYKVIDGYDTSGYKYSEHDEIT